ncbi:hypothetical protein PAEPH01_0125 [Pancytospora epiphaga]|nr:hypothetical protein PAEPH01_0125 [Pancytospora epiphaga]
MKKTTEKSKTRVYEEIGFKNNESMTKGPCVMDSSKVSLSGEGSGNRYENYKTHGNAQFYLEQIRDDEKDGSRLKVYFKFLITLVYFLCELTWVYWHLMNLEVTQNTKLFDWLFCPEAMLMIRDYLLLLVGYVFLMTMLDVVLK